MKTCSKCKQKKELSLFSKHKNGKLGVHHYCRECHNNQRRESYDYEKTKKIITLKKYGLTEKEVENMFNSQQGKCMICEKKYELYSVRKGLYIDHCHKTNKVRGLLCTKCNTLLGIWNDNINVLQNAVNYLISNNLKHT